MLRRFATFAAYALGAAMVTVGLVTIGLSIFGSSADPRPEIVTGGAALMLATGLVGQNGNGRGDTRPKGRR